MPDTHKVHFGLKNLAISVLTIGTGGTPSYATPVKIPGAVSIALAAQGEMTRFYADNVEYFTAENNAGYSGDLTVARFPDAVRTAIWGATVGSTSKVLTEKQNNAAVAFALLFQLESDIGNELHVFYNCHATRPAVNSNTNGASVEVATENTTITATALPDGRVHAQTTDDTPTTVSQAWFTSVFVATN